MLAENIKKIEESIATACAESGRAPEDVTLIAVTKTVDSATAEELVKKGIVNLAENRVDKMLEKQADLAEYSQIHWHLIGNLQRRKVKTIINQIDYFHALDSLSLAEEIQKRAEHTIPCFVEVNVSGEDSKHGITLAETESFIAQLADYPVIQVVGLMTMAPFAAESEEILHYFQLLKAKQQEIAGKKWQHAPCTELSMGMSHDYPLAIKAGATFIRIGTAFFQSNNVQAGEG